MGIDVSRLDNASDWNDLVERSSQSTPFHRFEALEVLAEHSGTELHRFCGYKGDEPVGLFPVFVLSRGPVRAAFSPPPDLETNYLGPALLNHEALKQRKTERRHRRFVEGVEEELREIIDPQYVHVRTGPGYTDPRPFVWNDFETTPAYTYEVDIAPDADDLFMTFSSDIRKNVRRADETDYELFEGDVTDVDRIIRMVRDRHDEQDVTFNVSESFARDLYRALPETMRAYVCRSDGRFVGGNLVLEDDEGLLAWQWAADYDLSLAVTDLVNWHVIRQARDRGVKSYDLGGANNPRLCGYKAKFNPDVRTYYTLERGSRPMMGLKKLYKYIR